MKSKAIQSLVLLATLALSAGAQAQDTSEEIRLLREQIERLDQKLKQLEQKAQQDAEEAEAKKKSSARVTVGSSGLAITSGDTNFTMKIRGYAQADARFFVSDAPGNDTFLLRRVRPIIEGTVFEKFDYRIMLDFASGLSSSSSNNPLLQDVYVNYRPLSEIQLQIGKFKEPVGLERLQSGSNLSFIERGYPTQLVPSRDVGIQLHGSLLNKSLDYAFGLFNGVADGGTADIDTADSDKDFAARIFAHPFRNTDIEALKSLGLGVAGIIGNRSGALRSYSTPGQQRFFSYRSGAGTVASPDVVADGRNWRISPQGYYYWGPFGLFGEYVISSQEVSRTAGAAQSSARLENTAWQVVASYFLTGEKNSYKSITPNNPFNPGEGGIGAWELVARVGQLSIDDDAFPLYATSSSARKATSYGLGVNWHLNKNIKLSLNYDYTDFDGGSSAPGSVTAENEQALFSRVQFSF